MDVVVGEGPAVLELLAGEDEALLVRRNAGDGNFAEKTDCGYLSAPATTTSD